MAGRISDHLSNKYGEKSVFFDFNSIPTGANYRKRIVKAIVDSEVIIAVIGQHWLGKNADGKSSRMNEANDNVRFELETAMKHTKPILPLLVNGANMPEESELPEALREMSSYNAAKVDSGQDFRMHMARLVEAIEETLNESSQSLSTSAASAPRSRRFWYAAAISGVAAAFAVLVWSGFVPFAARYTTASIADDGAVYDGFDACGDSSRDHEARQG